jgi:hypothetical protein
VPSLAERVRRRLASRRHVVDPFVTFELQSRLSRLSEELDGMASGRRAVFALAHHAEAATRAYEMTLAEACRLVGAPCPDSATPRESRIVLMTAELWREGWTW